MTPDEARTRTALAYNAAADAYDDEVNAYWDRFGRRTVDRLQLRPGDRVLDVCCGAGASAIPAAEAVAPDGRVLGIDLAENLLVRARAKARHRRLTNIEFRTGDMLESGLDSARFDAVVCVFGVFFVPDMPAAVGELWRLVRPGGRLAITTWGPRLFEPASGCFWRAVQAVRPDLFKAFNPWDRLTEPPLVRELFRDVEPSTLDVVAETGTHPLRSPDDFWMIVLGSGYRGTIEQLDEPGRSSVRARTLADLASAATDRIETNVVYAVATKAGVA